MTEAAGLLAAQRAAQLDQGPPELALRRDRLRRLRALLVERPQEWVTAIADDFGHRPRQEILLTEVVATLDSLDHAQARLRRWMRPERRRTALAYWPARNRVFYQPLGVVGIVSPWNYPVNLAIAPMVAALAAGNRVMLKPSEVTPATTALLAYRLAARFDPVEVAVVTGDVSVARAFTALPFDHLMFTGATATGREVMRAAAAGLVPVTLELGGKSPVILAPDADPARAAAAILRGKLINAGQSCVAPDHVHVPTALLDEFVAEARKAVARFYPDLAVNPDYGSIVSDRHLARLQALIEDAVAKGARVVPLAEAGGVPRRMPPTLLLDTTPDMRVMQEEIFGPLLPVLPYERIEDVLRSVNAAPRPLALYIFSDDRRFRRQVLAGTLSGGVCINDTMLQVGQEDMPFGGVGTSGMGAYHGRAGFLAFSHARSVMDQPRYNFGLLARPPYGRRLDRMIDFLLR